MKARTVWGAAVVLAFALAAPHAGHAQVVRANMDTTCSPCQDFFTYANGGWVKNTEFPASYSTVGAMRELADRNQETLHTVLEDAAAHWRTQSDADLKKLGAFYASCMDSTAAEKAGYKPIADELHRVSEIDSRKDLQNEIARLMTVGNAAPFYFGTEADPKASSTTIGQLYQSGLGLPDRDYYTKTDPSSDSLRQQYIAHVAASFQLVGESAEDAKEDAARVMKLETALATASMTRVAQRDPAAIYHKMSVADLQKLAPNVDWKAYFRAIGVPLVTDASTLDVSQPDFAAAVSQQMQSASMADWKAYLRWQIIDTNANNLSSAFFNEHFAFSSKLSGQRAPLPRWKRCAGAVDNALGEALGKAYVGKQFTPEAKAKALEMVNNLTAIFRERIQSNPWMSDSTKAQAQVKLSAILRKIGYPDTWRDYSTLAVNGDASFASNVLAANAFEERREFAKIGKPVDRMEWGMTPPTVNAYYNPTINEIVFPAGILQPPIYDATRDDAYNYGSAGAVIGHEMTHGFDDEGRQYDSKGNLQDWWSTEDSKRFDSRAQLVVDQFNGFVAVDTFHVNGKLTLGENIADLGGLTIAYYAYERSLEGKPRQTIDGFTPEQRFFMGFANLWRQKRRPETMKLLVNTDPHSPAHYRVDAPLANMPEFAQAFGCKEGDPMVRPAALRPAIW